MREYSNLVAAVRRHLNSLPKCRCGKLAVSSSLDSAGDGYPTCQGCEKPGWFDESGPYREGYADTALELARLVGVDA